jgi:hypothetical protein
VVEELGGGESVKKARRLGYVNDSIQDGQEQEALRGGWGGTKCSMVNLLCWSSKVGHHNYESLQSNFHSTLSFGPIECRNGQMLVSCLATMRLRLLSGSRSPKAFAYRQLRLRYYL